MFGRVKPLDAILATAEKKSLHRSLGAFQLTMLGVGAVIGTGIFVLTAEAAQKAGPGMMLSFVIAGVVCAVAALCYSLNAVVARRVSHLSTLVVGAVTVVVWKQLSGGLFDLYEIVPGFILCWLAVVVVSRAGEPSARVLADYDKVADARANGRAALAGK